MTSYAFRPQEISKRYTIKDFRLNGRSAGVFNWQPRGVWVRHGDRNRIHLVRIFNHLHYLGSHAPMTIRKKWSIIERQFVNKRVPQNASFRYATEISSGRWL